MSLGSTLRSIFTMGRGVTKGLPDLTEHPDPTVLFGQWYEEAEQAGIFLPEAMTLATVGEGGQPSARMVLLKEHGPEGFVFYTNYESRKSEELTANPAAALVLHWAILQRQVRIEGVVERVSRDQSEAYFNSRPRSSRIGAWASSQSRPLSDRADLERSVNEFRAKFEGEDVPLPEHWGGFRVRPHRIEFWQGRTSRLHDRLRYDWRDGTWSVTRLYP